MNADQLLKELSQLETEEKHVILQQLQAELDPESLKAAGIDPTKIAKAPKPPSLTDYFLVLGLLAACCSVGFWLAGIVKPDSTPAPTYDQSFVDTAVFSFLGTQIDDPFLITPAGIGGVTGTPSISIQFLTATGVIAGATSTQSAIETQVALTPRPSSNESLLTAIAVIEAATGTQSAIENQATSTPFIIIVTATPPPPS